MLDAIIISDFGANTFALSSTLRLQIDNKPALIQTISGFLTPSQQNTPKQPNNKNWQGAPKLNGLTLFSYLSSEGYKLELIDSYIDEFDRFKELISKKPKAIIISTTFITDIRILNRLAREIRSHCPGTFIIAGGPFVYSSYLLYSKINDKDYDTISPRNDYLFLSNHRIPEIDLFIVAKNGLDVLSTALGRIKSGSEFKSLSNIAYWDEGKYLFNNINEQTIAPTSINWKDIPDRFFKNGVMNLQASNGCPFKCEFCNFVKDRNSTYIKPLEELLLEMKTLEKKGIDYVRFVDDNFRLGKNDLNEVCETFIKEGLKVKWSTFIRASNLANTDLGLLKRAGCIEVQMGIESVDANMLKRMNKEADPGLYQTVIKSLLRGGINCACCFIMGFPGETSESVKKTVDFINNIQDDQCDGIFSWAIFPFVLIPLSPVYTKKKREQYNLKGYFDKWQHDSMTSDEAKKHIIEAYLKITNASPTYTGDDLDMLYQLPPDRRKKFFLERHRLSQLCMEKPVEKSTILNTFSKILFS